MVANSNEKYTKLALQLFDINAFKFGDFKMKVGINSPVYFDLRVIISYPDVMVRIWATHALRHSFSSNSHFFTSLTEHSCRNAVGISER